MKNLEAKFRLVDLAEAEARATALGYTRRAILNGLARHVEIAPGQRRVIMRNGGGDALDAVIAAVGGAHAWADADHRQIARHPRYPREGRLYV